MPFSFHSSLYKYHQCCPTTPAWLPPHILTFLCQTQNARPFPPVKNYSFRALLILQCANVSTSNACTTAGYRPVTRHNSGQLWVLPGNRPAKRPSCVNKRMLSCVPQVWPAITGTCRPASGTCERGLTVVSIPSHYRPAKREIKFYRLCHLILSVMRFSCVYCLRTTLWSGGDFSFLNKGLMQCPHKQLDTSQVRYTIMYF